MSISILNKIKMSCLTIGNIVLSLLSGVTVGGEGRGANAPHGSSDVGPCI